MITDKKYVFLMTMVFILAVLTGCAEKQPSEKVVAVINDYKMTGEDFNYESKELLHVGKLIGDIPVTREDILDALIIKEILLQEAQRKDLDKDKDFLRSIELHWEQTLIRNLLTKKSREIGKAVAVYEDEVAAYYDNMKEAIKAKVLVLGNERAGRILLGYEGDDIESYTRERAEKFSLSHVIPGRRYILGEDNSPLENSIFNIAKDKKRDLVEINGKWGLIIIEERLPIEAEPLSAIRENITRLIKMRKERQLMNEWIEGLRSKAYIKIDKKVLEELP